MKKLRLSLKTNWFEMTKAVIKTEDYREITPYWFSRFVFHYKDVFKYCTGYNWDDGMYLDEGVDYITTLRKSRFGFKPFDVNEMTLGYPKNEDTDKVVRFEHKGIEIRMGNPEWGAKPGKLYFVIKHGEILS